MAAIFLSASIPVIGRGQYYETADPFLIQCAVRELTIATVRRHKIVWGGDPAITPMIWSIWGLITLTLSSCIKAASSKVATRKRINDLTTWFIPTPCPATFKVACN